MDINSLLANKDDAAIQFKLAAAYSKGVDIEQDDTLSFQWCKKAAEQGHTNAQFMLGNMLGAGKGCNKNDTLAFKWFKKATNAELNEARKNYRSKRTGSRYS